MNTIAPETEPWFPGDEFIERRIRAFIRWNAAVMVAKANKHADGIGGHLSTFASSASLYEVGFNWFFRGKDDGLAGDHVYFQGHAAPGIYARAFLEGRLSEQQLDNFRREIGGAGWNVIKVIWGSKWDELLHRDVDGVLLNKMNTTVDGEFQRYAVEQDGSYIRDHFFGPDPRLRKMVEHLSDEDLRWLPRGGHDYRKLYAAYKAATELEGAPTVILAKTVKGWTLGSEVEGRNATHQIKKMTNDQLLALRERLYLHDQIPEESLAPGQEPPYYRPPEDSDEYRYMMDRRRALDGPLPSRVVAIKRKLELPQTEVFGEFDAGSGTQQVSTTMAFTRLLRNLARDEKFGSRVVPIIPDEARTFGMDA